MEIIYLDLPKKEITDLKFQNDIFQTKRLSADRSVFKWEIIYFNIGRSKKEITDLD